MLGMTSDTSRYVYLSDGGHFENLALYEMVRRRCRFIVVSDAGCDPEFAFEDIGNAVRKIEIDLGVPIHFRGLDKLKPRHTPNLLDELLGEPAPPPINRGNAEPPPYHAIGIIDYPAADGPGVERASSSTSSRPTAALRALQVFAATPSRMQLSRTNPRATSFSPNRKWRAIGRSGSRSWMACSERPKP
jgi:hypothetical protein